VGIPKGIGIAKDKLGLRPGVMAETDEIFAIASEEMALHSVIDPNQIEQIAPGETRAYTI
jgi:glutamate synthase domain-containing protein 1